MYRGGRPRNRRALLVGPRRRSRPALRGRRERSRARRQRGPLQGRGPARRRDRAAGRGEGELRLRGPAHVGEVTRRLAVSVGDDGRGAAPEGGQPRGSAGGRRRRLCRSRSGRAGDPDDEAHWRVQATTMTELGEDGGRPGGGQVLGEGLGRCRQGQRPHGLGQRRQLTPGAPWRALRLARRTAFRGVGRGGGRSLGPLEWPGQAHGGSVLLVQPAIDRRDLADEALPVGVLELEDLVERPVQVVGDVRDLLVEAVGRVRQDPPRRSPAISTVNSCRQAGQATAAWVVPSWLMRR